MNLPEITSIQRLILKPGEVLIVRVPQPLAMATAAMLRSRVCEQLGLDDDRVLILDSGMSLTVLAPTGEAGT